MVQGIVGGQFHVKESV